MDEQHIYHHNAPAAPQVNVSAERNTRGWNYSATVIGARSPDEALELLRKTLEKLETELKEKLSG